MESRTVFKAAEPRREDDGPTPKGPEPRAQDCLVLSQVRRHLVVNRAAHTALRNKRTLRDPVYCIFLLLFLYDLFKTKENREPNRNVPLSLHFLQISVL